MKIIRMPLATADIEAADEWWREHRDEKDLFVTELMEAAANLERIPNAGRLVRGRGVGRDVRSVVLPKTEKTVYYRVDAERDEVQILRVYGSRRRRRPKLR